LAREKERGKLGPSCTVNETLDTLRRFR